MQPMAIMPVSDGSQAVPMKRGNVALVEISGPMSRGGTPCFGAGSTVDARAALRAAERDADVTAIVFVIDTPGGTVAGTGDLGDEVARIAKTKPIYFFVPDQCCSAGYWVASQGTAIWSSPNAQQIGNINARLTLINVSESLKKAGVEVTILKGKRGTFKDAGDGSKPFSPEEIEYLQGEIDRMEAAFAAAVARGRNVPLAKALEWSDGRWFDAATALQMGLIDQIGSLDELMQKLLVPPDARSYDPPELTGDDDSDDESEPDLVVKAAETIILTPAQKTALSSAGVRLPIVETRPASIASLLPKPPLADGLKVVESAAAVLIGAKTAGDPIPASQAKALPLLPAQAADPISAPGGQPGSAGISTAPPSAGAENQTGTPRMSFRQNLINALAVRGFGKMVVALNGTTSEDPEVLARIVTDQVEAQATDLVNNHPLITVSKAHGVTDVSSFNAFHDRARNGDRYLEDMRAEAKVDAIRAFGPESGPIVGASVDGQSLGQAIASRDAWRRMADERVGIGPDGSAPTRKTAPSATTTVAVDAVEAKSTRLWDKLTDAERSYASSHGMNTPEKQDAYAANFPGLEAR